MRISDWSSDVCSSDLSSTGSARHMGNGCKSIRRSFMADDQFGGIQIRNLYKIFGANAAQHIEAIKGGLSKTDLNAQFGLVLGLKNINIDIPSGRVQVVMGPDRKSTRLNVSH